MSYDQIHENFYFGLFGGLKLIIDKNTGYFNATQLCRDGGKEYKNWIRNKETRALVEYVQMVRGLPAFYVVNNGPSAQCDIIRGTYVPKELILSVASWLSSEFYLMCSDIVNDVLIRDFKIICNEFEHNNELLQTCLKEAEDKMLQLKTNNLKLAQGYVKPTRKRALHNVFAIIKKNNCDEFPLYAVRSQKSSFNTLINTLRKRYPNMEYVCSPRSVPYAMNIFHRLKEELKYMKFNQNCMALIDQTEEKLLQDIETIIRDTSL